MQCVATVIIVECVEQVDDADKDTDVPSDVPRITVPSNDDHTTSDSVIQNKNNPLVCKLSFGLNY